MVLPFNREEGARSRRLTTVRKDTVYTGNYSYINWIFRFLPVYSSSSFQYDLIVLSDDILKIDPMEITNLKVDLTMIGGVVEYERAE